MRVDLALESIQFAFSPLILLQDNFLHKVIDLFVGLLYGISQMADLLRAADIDLRFFPRFITLHRIIQFQKGTGYPHRDHSVYKGKHHSHKQYQHHDKVPDIQHAMGKSRIGDHPYQLPAGITDSVHQDLPMFPVKFFIIDPFLIICGSLVIFLKDPVADLHLPGMIDDLPIAVAEIEILTAVGRINLVHHTGNAGIVHIYQKDSRPGISPFCNLHRPA